MDFGLVLTCLIQNAVDLCKHLLGLLFYAKAFVVRNNARHTDITVLDVGATVPVARLKTLEGDGGYFVMRLF